MFELGLYFLLINETTFLFVGLIDDSCLFLSLSLSLSTFTEGFFSYILFSWLRVLPPVISTHPYLSVARVAILSRVKLLKHLNMRIYSLLPFVDFSLVSEPWRYSFDFLLSAHALCLSFFLSLSLSLSLYLSLSLSLSLSPVKGPPTV